MLLSFVKKKPKTLVAVFVLLCLVLYLIFCGLTVAQVRTFRHHPQRAVAVRYFRGSWPHQIIARLLVFKAGAKPYNADLLEWAYHSKLIEDGFWNRWILERNIENVPDEQRAQLLPHYPLTPTSRLIPFIVKALNEGHFQVLPLLGRTNTPEAQQIYKSWVNDQIVKTRDPRLFVAASGSLAQSNVVFLPDLLRLFWPQLNRAQKARVTAKIAAHIQNDPNVLTPVFDWARSALFDASAAPSNGDVALLGRFLSTDTVGDKALRFLGEKGASIAAARSPLLIHFISKEDLASRAAPILKTLQDRNNEALLEVLHSVAHQDLAAADSLADPFLNVPDSELRKGVIVILVRHGSMKGKARIAESFTGSAPRKTMFPDSSTYGSGNTAAQTYRELSTHDYREAGKTWPPSYYGKRPSNAEVVAWKQFIAQYPWFPGTDDAYYRLSYSQLVQRDYPGCFITVKEYLRRSYWSDNDVFPYMTRVLRRLILESDVADSEFPFARYLRTLAQNPMASMITGSSEHIDELIDALNYFIANPNTIRFLNTNLNTIVFMRDTAVMIKAAPADSISRLVAAKIERGASATLGETNPSASQDNDLQDDSPSDDDEDEATNAIYYFTEGLSEKHLEPTYNSGVVLAVLYGIFDLFPEPSVSATKGPSPSDPGDAAIHQMAAYLNSSIANTSVDAARQHSIDELLALALLHTDRDFERWLNEFRQTRDFLSAINTSDVPSISAARHQQLLKQMTQ